MWQFSTAVCLTILPSGLLHCRVSHNCGLISGSYVTLTQKPPRHSTERKVSTSSQAVILHSISGSTLAHKPLLHPSWRDIHNSSQAITSYCTGAKGTFTLAHKPLLHPSGNLSSRAYTTVHLSRGRGVHTICQVHTVLTSCVRHDQQAPQLLSKMNNRIYLGKFPTSLIPKSQYKLLSSSKNLIICYCVDRKFQFIYLILYSSFIMKRRTKNNKLLMSSLNVDYVIHCAKS